MSNNFTEEILSNDIKKTNLLSFIGRIMPDKRDEVYK